MSTLRLALLHKYVLILISVMSTLLVISGSINIWMSYAEQKRSLIRLQQEQAHSAAAQIAQYMKGFETQLGWLVQTPWVLTTDDDRHVDAIRLLTLVPAVHELVVLNPQGVENLRLSRLGSDVLKSGADWSQKAEYQAARRGPTYFGALYFQRNSEPYIRIALAGQRRDTGVVVADINLKLIWEVVSKIRIGERGRAYVVDATGRLVAHPDISLVLRNTDLSGLSHIGAARRNGKQDAEGDGLARDLHGEEVLAAHAGIPRLDWLVVVERPTSEAFAGIYSSLRATVAVLLAGIFVVLLSSVLLARAMTQPIRKLQAGAAEIGSGRLSHRISIKTGDELEELGDQFNDMAARLEASYATLEDKVAERTEQLATANAAKSRFLAAASHDLRQPLHALNLFVGQLRERKNASHDDQNLVNRIDAALSSMNQQFDALLDISKLDAGAITPQLTTFAVSTLFERLEATYASAAEAKGLLLRLVRTDLVIRSDLVLLERILSNFVSNAVRYTNEGGIVIGCRRKGRLVRIDVADTGIGIPEEHQGHIFSEFYRVSGATKLGGTGFGLGLSIVQRLAMLLDHPIEVATRPGHGSRFSVVVPKDMLSDVIEAQPVADALPAGFASGRSALVVDDDPAALDATMMLLEEWGYRVIDAGSMAEALAAVSKADAPPDVIVTDFHLGDGETGLDLVATLRACHSAATPAIVISADRSNLVDAAVRGAGLQMLHKPVFPASLRAVLQRLAPIPNRDAAQDGSRATAGVDVT